MWWEIKNHLEVENGELFIGGIRARNLTEKFGTPLYVYNINRIIDNFRRFKTTIEKHADREVRVHYAMKANSNITILKHLLKEEAWIDALSPGEVERAIEAGFPPNKILFSGTSVSDSDLRQCLKSKVKINIDSISQLKRLKKLLAEFGLSSLDISIRWDPGIQGAGANWKIITAGKESYGKPIKFGIPSYRIIDAFKESLKNNFNPIGLHFHVGSQWLSDEELKEYFNVVEETLSKAKEIITVLKQDLEFLDFGGGPGIRYKEEEKNFPLDKYAGETFEKIKNSGIKTQAIAFEPGRYVVGDSGLLLTEINTLKERYGYNFVGVDSGFNQLIRPVLYDAHHEIINCDKADFKKDFKAVVVGNICETGDILSKTVIPTPEEGNILAFHNAGAYCFSMASEYTRRKLPKEICIFNKKIISTKDTI